ncbi:MAG TPA: HAMP domain-containing protein, partial [Spirochaetota bacterium]|nr:HAMP domain-containing protein [Spirochaetota bacterium]
QYGRTLANMMDNPDVLNGLNAPSYKNKQDEINVSLRIIGDENIKGGLRNTIEEKIEGAVFLYELDRKSIIDKTDYKVHFVSSDNALPNFDRFINDPLFLTLKNDNSIKLIAGKLSPGTIVGFESDKKPAIIFPYYPAPAEKESDSFSKFILVTLFPDFIPHFYEDIVDLKFGTLYILDRNDNILAKNHPNSSEDYYDYDEKQKKYNLGEDLFYDKDEGMSFYEYSLLNTDEKILKIDSVKSVLGNINDENIEKINSEKIYTIFNNTKYLTVAGYGEETKFKFIYFHPLGQIRKPIYDVIKIIVIITVAIIVLLLFAAIFFSKKLTDPIINLSIAADQITDGDYNIKVNASGNKEITLLSEAFNKMTMEIRDYTDNLEKTVEKRTVELKEANEKLKIAHEALWGEMELAKKIQTSLLPVEIDIPDYDISAIMISANEVGGDFYDVVNINGKNFIAIGDVSGHGVTPGLIMMMAHTAIRAIIIQNPDISCSKLYKSLN